MSSWFRRLLPRQKCHPFTDPTTTRELGIGPIFVINLDRQPDRMNAVLRELSRILDRANRPLSERTVRWSAFDSQTESPRSLVTPEVEPFYTLRDQLFVEPQPLAVPDEFDLVSPIRMSEAEVAVARSHIEVWRTVARSAARYSLVLEDDVYFQRGFGQTLDAAWNEMRTTDLDEDVFDLLYVSYREARYGAPKELLSANVFRPDRGLWFLSGYILSKRGAQTLLTLLPCRGPIDLWINYAFPNIKVRALRRSMVNQRMDTSSTNSYSVLPMLSRIGILDDSGGALFHQRPSIVPVFVFGDPSSGLSSVALALSMLGYRCCSDLDDIPESELTKLVNGESVRVFNAYVNIESLWLRASELALKHPAAKFLVIGDSDKCTALLKALSGADAAYLNRREAQSWAAVCGRLKLSPPPTKFPNIEDIGQRRIQLPSATPVSSRPARRLRFDSSPWIADPHVSWTGIVAIAPKQSTSERRRSIFTDDLADGPSRRWWPRNDTFPGNLGLFRPANVTAVEGQGVQLTVVQEPVGVRDFTAASISSRAAFLYGRFEATLQAARGSGLVTGFFLHRDSPRQEIDFEITGNRPERVLVNVFYNPGTEGARFDYGYRGTPVEIELGFDAAAAPHRYAIEWDRCEIRWFVDGELVHARAEWNPTPIPNLPMTLHLNTWPTRSRELAGRLSARSLPASAIVRSIVVDALELQPLSLGADSPATAQMRD
ncbi:MAG: family 16 glycosylhydrolase [Vicinamibacterales bacterium]